MKALVVLMPSNKPSVVWKKGLAYARRYNAELVALILVDDISQLPEANNLMANLLAQAKQTGVISSSEIVVGVENHDVIDLKERHGAKMVIM